MIADIEVWEVGCVITKGFSRLGRNYIEAGSYIEIFFPKHNVRYIVVTDGVDSLIRQELDESVLKRLISKILAGEVRRGDRQKCQEIEIVYNFVGEISGKIE